MVSCTRKYNSIHMINHHCNSVTSELQRTSHDDIGHLGLERSLDLLKDRFYWAGLSTDMENHIQTCDRCLCFKSKPQKTELYAINTTYLLEFVHMDFLTIESGKTGKNVNILVVTYYFTHYAQAFITPSQTAWVVAKMLWDKFFMHYGLPEKFSVTKDETLKVDS